MGRHPHRALTARTVQSFNRRGRIADGGGLYLVLAPGGSKSWVLRTVVNGKRRDIGLGSAALVTLADAREKAHDLRKIARAGGDPLARRRHERREIPTFEKAAREVHAAHASSFKNAKHSKQWLSSLGPIFKVFGSKPVHTIVSADVLAALSPLWLDRPETSRRILQRVKIVFDWCKAQGYCDGSNPTDGVKKVLPKHRSSVLHHAALRYQDVPLFVQALRKSDATEMVRLAFELTILCATRTSETLLATWEEVDLSTNTWTIPANRMKAGVEHRIPLSSRSVEILERAKAIGGGSFIFRGRTATKPLSTMVFLMTLRRMNRSNITAHGFRSSFRDWAAERTSVPRAICEAALAHTLRDKTEAAYNRTDLFDRRKDLMQAWSQYVTCGSATVIAISA